MALSYYTKGFIYEQFAEYLNKEASRFVGSCIKDHRTYLVKSEADSYKKAIKYFLEAYREFKKIDHKMGVYMSKQHEYELMKNKL